MSAVHKVSSFANVCSYLAIPVSCAAFAVYGAAVIASYPESLSGVFYDYSLLWTIVWILACISISVGVVLKRIRPTTNLYIWFEYPGLIIAGVFALVYAGAMLLLLGLGGSWLAVGAFVGIGGRFILRWIEVHLLLMVYIKSRHHRQS